MKKPILLLLSGVLAIPLPAAAQVVGAAGISGPAVPGAPVGPALNFSLTPQQLQSRYDAVTARLDSALAGIASVPEGSVTFANTVKAYESATAAWQREITPIAFQSAVSPDPAVRAAVTDLEKKMNAYGVALSLREDLFKQFERAEAKGETLDAADKRLLDSTLKGFRGNGLALPAEQREKLKAMQTRLGELASEFARNIDEKKDSLIVGRDGIEGLPGDFVATLEKTADGRYVVPVDEPSMVAYMRFAASGESRKAMLTKFNNRGGERNLEVLHEALGLRRDVAQLLGHKDYPTMVMKDRMAKTPERVLEFLNRVKDAVAGRARQDLADLLEMKRKDEPAATRIDAWERAYYARKLRSERYAFDTEQVKQYFPVDRVVEGTMRVYQKTLGVTFQELQGGAKWAPDVRLFEISDAKTGRRIGHFYLDLTPREGKHGHPAAFQIVSGRRLDDGSYEEPVSAMVADFPKAAPGQPSLLTHGDVETFFHEFGHLMHQTLTRARYASFSGSNVALDFVEAPSQMLENFVWERGVLDELSGHWKDGSKLPEDLFAKMLKARSFLEGTNYAAQAAFALGDLVLHTDVPADVSAVFDKIVADITGVATIPGTHFVGSFDHLMGGYGAGYYAYLWSQVFAQDIYTLFKADGVISPVIGAKYRKEILEVGSERPEMDSLRAFLGREPSEEAFMREVRGEEPQAQAPKARQPESVVIDGTLSPETFFSLQSAVRAHGPLPAGVVVTVIPHATGNPQIRIAVDGVNVYWEYLYHSESDLARLRRRWWNPLTWFAGFGSPSSDLSKRFEAVLALASEGSAKVRGERPAARADR
ncbi:MAG TPA: M3 family metallopeptidase [Elusimicrobiota bacterium]|nr:M3 family metallopeptidase [Elusimicrobiota bacterium]